MEYPKWSLGGLGMMSLNLEIGEMPGLVGSGHLMETCVGLEHNDGLG